MILQPRFLLMGILTFSLTTATLATPTTPVAPPSKATAPDSIPGITLLEVGKGGDHQNGLISYDHKKYGLPPAGGPHNPVWQNCGIYEKPITNEHAVHSLEHGAVWIAYQPNLPKNILEKLKKAVQNNPLAILSPYPKLPAPVVATAWGVQKRYIGFGAEVGRFIAKYSSAQGSLAPEMGAPCEGGTSDVDTRL